MRPFIGLSSLLQLPRLPSSDVPDLPVSEGLPDFYSQQTPIDFTPPQRPPYEPPDLSGYSGWPDSYGQSVPTPEPPPPPKPRAWIDDYYASLPPLVSKAKPAKIAPITVDGGAKTPPKLKTPTASSRLLADMDALLNEPDVPITAPASRPAASMRLYSDKPSTAKDVNLPLAGSTAVDEPAFQTWYAQKAKQYKLSANPDDPKQFYDYRAAFLAGAEPDKTGHWPSAYKRAGHPNEVVGGFNTRTRERVAGTPRASEADLVKAGWDPKEAATLASLPEPTGKPPSAEGFRLRSPTEEAYVQGAQTIRSQYQPTIDAHTDTLRGLNAQLTKQHPAIEKASRALTVASGELQQRTQALLADDAAWTARYEAWKAGVASGQGNQPATYAALQKERDGLQQRYTALEADGRAFDVQKNALAPQLAAYNGLVEQQQQTVAATQATAAQARAALQQHTAGFQQAQQAGPRAYTPPPTFPGPDIPTALLRKFLPVQVPDVAQAAPPAAERPTFDPETHRIDRAVPKGMAIQQPGPIDAVSGLIQAPYGAALAASMARGESTSGQNLPGHEGEATDFLGRLWSHASMIAEGHGGAVAPIGVVRALVNPPGSVSMPANEEEMLHRAELGQPQSRKRSRAEMVALETGRRGMDALSKMLVDPTAIAATGLHGVTGNMLAGAFSAEGIATAAQVARDPKATAEDVAEAMLGVAITSLPMAVRATIDLGPSVAKGAADVVGAGAYPFAKAMRASILAAKLQFPDAARSLGQYGQFSETGQVQMSAGVHAPLASMEHGAFATSSTVPDVGRHVTLPDAIRWALDNDVDLGVSHGLGGFTVDPTIRNEGGFVGRAEAKPPQVTLPREMSPGATVQMPDGGAGTIVATEMPTHGIPRVTVRMPDGSLGAYRPDVLTVTAPVAVEQLPPGEVIGRVIEANSMGNAAQAAQLKDVLLQRIGRAVAAQPNLPEEQQTALKDLAAKHPDDVGVTALRLAFQLLQTVAPDAPAQPLTLAEPARPSVRVGPRGTTQWVEDGRLYIQFNGQTFSFSPGDPAPVAVPSDKAPSPPQAGPASEAPTSRPNVPPAVAAAPATAPAPTANTIDVLRNMGLTEDHIAQLTPEQISGVIAGTMPIPARVPHPPATEPAPAHIGGEIGPAKTAAHLQQLSEQMAVAKAAANEAEYERLKAQYAHTQHAQQTSETARLQREAMGKTLQHLLVGATGIRHAGSDTFEPITTPRGVELLQFSMTGVTVQHIKDGAAPGEFIVRYTRAADGGTSVQHEIELRSSSGEQFPKAAPVAPPVTPTSPAAPTPPTTAVETPAPQDDDLSDEEIAAFIKAAQGAAPEGPRWKSSDYTTREGYGSAPDVLAATLDEQTARRADIAHLAAHIESLAPDSPEHARLAADLAALQKVYEGTWKELADHMDGIDVEALDQQAEDAAKTVVQRERAAEKANAKKADKEEAQPPTEAPAPPKNARHPGRTRAEAEARGSAALTDAEWLRYNELQTREHAGDELNEDETAEVEAFTDRVREAMGVEEKDVDETLSPDEYPRMSPEDIFPTPAATVRAKTLAGDEQLTSEQAQARIDEWKAEAKRIGEDEDHSQEVVISLFDRTGVWSQPYVDAGYDVRRIDIANGDDVLKNFPIRMIGRIKSEGKTIVGVLAAPPCTSFAVSGARWWESQHDQANQQMVEKKYGFFASRYFDTPLDYANTLVAATQFALELANPTQFHAMENPVGRIAEQNDLPTPLFAFDPNNFGDPYTKKTQLWGAFNTNLPTAPVEPTKGSFIATLRGDNAEEKLQRSETPEGFAYAFFMANHGEAQAAAAEEEATSQPPVASQPPVSRPNALMEPLKTTWMNESSIEEAVERFKDHPVLGPAARFLEAFKDQVNAHSDGWPYWKQPSHAAGRLQALIYGHLMAGMGAYPRLPEATVADVTATMAPIKSFMTRAGEKAGIKLPELKFTAEAYPPPGKAHAAMEAREPKILAEIAALEAKGTHLSPTEQVHLASLRIEIATIENRRKARAKDQKKEGTNVQTPAQTGEGTTPAQPEGEAETEEVADRLKYEDGRLIPRPGDKVSQMVRGFGGSPAYVHGDVLQGRNNELRVKITGGASLLGSVKGIGKTQKLDASWTVVGDPEIARRTAAREQAEKDRKEQDAREQAEYEAEAKRKTDEAIAGGHAPLTRETPVGSQVVNHFDGSTETLTEQHPEYGPLLDDRTIGNENAATGAWDGYSVMPPPAAATEPTAKSWKAEMQAGAGDWSSNGLRFATKAEAEASGQELLMRWSGAKDTRAVESDDPVTHTFEDGRNVRLEEAATPAPSLPVSQPPAPRPTQQALSDIDRKKAENKAERAALMQQLRDELGRIGVGTPLDPKIVRIVYKIARSYVRDGVLEFQRAAVLFREEYGESANAETAFELAWPLVQEMAKGQSFAAALATAHAMTNRPTVAAAVEAYSREGDTNGPAADLDGGGAAGAGEPRTSASGAGDGSAGQLEGQQPARPDGAPGESDRGGERGADGGVARPDDGTPAAEPGAPPTRGGGVHATGDVEAPVVSNDVDVAASRGQAPLHFTITQAEDLTEGSWIQKLDNNLAAIRLLKELQTRGRMATSDEQKVLAKYIGWGHTNLAPIVDLRPEMAAKRKDPRQRQARTELEGLLSSDELRELGESTANAHYSFLELPRAMWDLAQRLGFQAGTVIEPAVGIGHFFGTMPGPMVHDKRTFLFGVDKEPIAAGIAHQLYQGARILTGPLQEQIIPDDYFDLAISNVPFGKIAIFDPAFVSSDRAVMARSIHNYYFGKALDAVRPGGLVVFITSRYTLDAQTDVIRNYISNRARFLGAIRLPDSAFKKTAGTEVVTDVIVLQKREIGESAPIVTEEGHLIGAAPHEQAWTQAILREDLPQVADADGNWSHPYVNQYFQAHPEMVLGEQNSSGKMNNAAYQYNVQAPGAKPADRDAHWQANGAQQLAGAIAQFPERVFEPAKTPPPKLAAQAPADGKQGSYVLEDGKLFVYDKGKLTPSDLKSGQFDRMVAYLPIRDAYQVAIDVMTAHGSDEDLAKAQAVLQSTYDAFVDQFGRVSKPYNTRVIDRDPNGARVLALEITKLEKAANGRTIVTYVGPADIFSKRVYNPPKEPTSATSATDALVHSLAWKGQVDVPFMARLLGQPETVVIDALKNDLFYDPSAQAWVTKDEYLSGDVVTKLADAEAASRTDPAREPNVTALRAVQPVPKGPDEIAAPFGATWVPPDVYQQFMREISADPNATVRVTNTDFRTQFYVEGFGSHEFMPTGYNFGEWASEAMNGRLPVVKKLEPDGNGGQREVRDEEGTEQVRQSLAQLREQWDTWWRSNLAVSDKLTAINNAMFNRDTAREFDGAHLVLPNKSPDIDLRWWQKNVIWRAIQAGNTLLAHAVGAGKTYALIGIAGEMKRLGLARKPMLVVPNHLVQQTRESYMRMYPTARILVPVKSDFKKAKRKRLMAWMANNEWDAIVVAQSHFVRIAVAVPTLQAFVREQEDQIVRDGAEQMNMTIDEFKEAVDEYANATKKSKTAIGARGVPRSVKDIVRQVLNLRARLQKRLDQQGKDSPVIFEQIGVDALLVDEAHLFKNLYFSTSKNDIAGLKGSDSQRAMDMYLKIRMINQASNQRNVIFATGTPISNALSEAYTMFRYLAQPTLERLGMGGFDSWANSFAVAVPALEPSADGSYKERTRLRDWSNLDQLSKLFRRFSDVITPEQMRAELEKQGIAFPKLKNGRATTIAVKAHPLMGAFMAGIAARVAAIKRGDVDPRVDNHLKISSDATLAAIDMRLVDSTARDFAGSRVQTAAAEINRIYRASMKTKGTQIVFLDVGVPQGRALGSLSSILGTQKPTTELPADADVSDEADDEEDDEDTKDDLRDLEKEAAEEIAALTAHALDVPLYEDLKRILVERYKIPANEIAFTQQAKNDIEQGLLFDAVNEGRIRVLVGSTAKGATGMNVQKRLIALHHLDVPWRPADIEQREGRILRQMNDNLEVEILRYVTEKSFDEYRWGLVAAKQGFIYQFLRGEITTGQDLDPAQFDMEVAQALGSGDPNVFRMLNVERELKGLRARFVNYERRRQNSLREKGWAESAKQMREQKIADAQPIVAEAKAWEEAPTVVLTVEIPTGHGYYTGMRLKDTATPVIYDWKDADARKRFQDDIVRLLKLDPYDNDRVIATAGPFVIKLQRVEQFAEDEHGITRTDRVVRTAALTVETRLIKGAGPRGSDAGIQLGTSPNFDAEKPPDYRRSLDAYAKSAKVESYIEDQRRFMAHAERDLLKAENALAAGEFGQKADLDAKEVELASLRAVVGQKRAHAVGGVDEEPAPLELEPTAEQDDDEENDGESADSVSQTPTKRRKAASSVTAAAVGTPSANTAPQTTGTTTGPSGTPVTLSPIEFPELVDLARELQQTPRVVRRFRKVGKAGEFSATGIKLHAGLFKQGRERDLAAVLAHEIGHLADWLPDYTLKRGNLLGRIRSLLSFLKSQYTAPDGTTVKNAVVRTELLNLTAKWNPWDAAKATAAYRAYRRSARELYADAISVLLNNPGLAQAEAPVFFKRFFEELDAKPEVKRAFFGIWELLSGTRDELVARRLAGVRGMFDIANTKAVDLLKLRQQQRHAERTDYRQHLWNLAGSLVDKHMPFIQRLKQDATKGVTVRPQDNPFYALSERAYRLAGQAKAWLQTQVQPLLDRLAAHGLIWEDFGEFLMYERIIAGDRSEIANPRGLSPAAAQELHDARWADLTPTQQVVVRDSLDAFRDAVKDVAHAAYNAGLYADKTWEQIDKNPAYATYRTIEHLDEPISSRIYKQIGTVKDILNPADATVLKTLVTLRAIEHQRVKVNALVYLQSLHPEDIQDAKTDRDGRPLPPRADLGLRLVTYFDKGRIKGKYVDPYIANSLENKNAFENEAIIRGWAWVNSYFKKAYTTYNPGFQAFNLRRDFKRFWRNTPTMTRRRALQRYWQARHLAAVRTFGLASPEASSLRKAYRALTGKPADSPTAAETQAWQDLIAAEKVGILGTTFREHLGHDIDEKMIMNILASAGVGAFEEKHYAATKPFFAVLDALADVGDFIETLPKAAGIYEFKGSGGISDIPPNLRQFIRAKIGSPDYQAGGTLKPLTNNLLMFSNAITQGWRSDMDVATQPTTASGFWWKTFQANFLPKLLTVAALMAAAGEAASDDDDANAAVKWTRRQLAKIPWLVAAGKVLRKIPVYDLTNYLVLPLGTDEKGNAVAVRIPQDDTGRFLGGVFFKMLGAAAGDRNLWAAIADILAYSGGQLPSQAPLLSAGVAAAAYAGGANPYDAFRQKSILSTDEQKARQVSWQPLKHFAGWEFQQLGGGVIWKFYPGDERPKHESTGQAILDLPVISDTVGRFVKITKAGEKERYREAGAAVEAEMAGRHLTEQAAVNNALDKYWALPKSQQNIQTQERMATDLAKQLYPAEKDKKKQAGAERRLKARMTLSVVHGEDDALAEPVLAAGTNEEKVTIILKARPDYTPAQFEQWLTAAARQHVISPQVVLDVHRRMHATTIH